MKSKLVTIALLIVIIFSVAACEKRETTKEEPYEKYLILGLTEEQYLDELSNDLQFVYAQNVGIGISELKDILMRHMTEEVATKFATPNTGKTIEGQKIECNVDYIMYAYGKHQKDGIPRVISKLTVRTKERYWKINLEMKLNTDNLIYDIEVY